MSKFSFVPTQEPVGVTESYLARQDVSELLDNATTVAELNPVVHYFTVDRSGLADAVAMLDLEFPSVGEVIHYTWAYPGIEVRDRAIELLGSHIPDTLQFARRFHEHEIYPRPFFANKTWDILISALGLADEVYAPHCRTWIEEQLRSPNAAKRLAAFDALQALEAGC